MANEKVLQRAEMGRKLICEIRRKQMKFMGHVVRKDGLEVLELTGKIKGKRSRGRKRMFWLTSLNEWIRDREGVKH